MAVRIPVNEQNRKRERRHLTQDQKYTLYSRIAAVCVLLVAHLLQNTPHMFPTFFGVHAFLLLPLAICIAMVEKTLAGTVLGIFAGVLWDTASAHVDGFYALFFMVVCTLVCILMNYLMRNNLVTALLLCGGSILLFCLVHWLVFVVAGGVEGAARMLLTFYLPSALYTFIFAPIDYFVIRAFLKKLRAKYPRKAVTRRPE